jgi:hypothetical protein
MIYEASSSKMYREEIVRDLSFFNLTKCSYRDPWARREREREREHTVDIKSSGENGIRMGCPLTDNSQGKAF